MLNMQGAEERDLGREVCPGHGMRPHQILKTTVEKTGGWTCPRSHS